MQTQSFNRNEVTTACNSPPRETFENTRDDD